jgi:hypothetical protein
LAEEACDPESVGGAESEYFYQRGADEGLSLVGLEGPTHALDGQLYGILTTSEDLSIEQEVELCCRAESIALLSFESVLGESEIVAAWKRGVEGDLRDRLGDQGAVCEDGEGVVAWALSSGFSTVVIVTPPVGPQRARVSQIARRLSEHGVVCRWYSRQWDRELFPLADRGFFPFWERIRKRFQRHGSLLGV